MHTDTATPVSQRTAVLAVLCALPLAVVLVIIVAAGIDPIGAVGDTLATAGAWLAERTTEAVSGLAAAAGVIAWRPTPPAPLDGPAPACLAAPEGCTQPVVSVENRADGTVWHGHDGGVYHVSDLPLPIEWSL